MNDLYSKPCPCCGGSIFHNLADEKDDSWDTIYDEMVQQLLNDSETFTNKALYKKTAAALMQAIGKGLTGSIFNDDNSKQKLLNAFKINIKAFSYAKNLTQFKYIKDHIFDDKGNLLDAAAVKKIVYDSGEVFNNRYLTVEHQFATQSAIMAHKWDTLNTEYLEFSTVGDNRVRPEHEIFDKFTAPKSDPIWKRLYTPLSWGCRCTIIPGVKSGLSKEYDSKWANKVVDPLVKGTIFDNNVGITHEIFTKNHPYFKTEGANDNIYIKASREEQKAKDLEIREWAKSNIPDEGITLKLDNFKTGEVYISRGSIKSIGDHFSEPELKEVAKHVISNLKSCKYIDKADLDKNKANYQKKLSQGVTKYYYYEFEWNNQMFRLNTEEINYKIEKPYSVNIIVKK